MKPPRLLFISGSVGLGHVTRDLAIARALRRALPGVEIDWLAAPPGSEVLGAAGERLLPGAADWADESAIGAQLAGSAAARGRSFQFNVLRSFLANRRHHQGNVEVFRKSIADQSYDLILGDETYEIALALRARSVRLSVPFIMIYDFIGADPATRSPLEWLAAYITNRRWALGHRRAAEVQISSCFIGEAADIPDRRFGPGLPHRRRWAQERCRILGYILPFDAATCRDQAAVRRDLGYGEGPLVVCTAGGSGVGRELLDLCVESFSRLRERLPDLSMEIVGGPRLELRAPETPPGLGLRGYVPDLYKHFAAADLVVAQGGGTTTLELTALRRPFLYFPLEGHFEQQVHVAGRLARHGAGVRMAFAETSAEDLAAAILAHIGKDVAYEPIPLDGAEKLAELATQLIAASESADHRPH